MSDNRLKVLAALILAALLAVAGRLFYLQVLCGRQYARLAQSNCLQRQFTPAARGLICDRGGTVLAEDDAAEDVVVDPVLLRGSTGFMTRVGSVFRPSSADRAARVRDVQATLLTDGERPEVRLEFTFWRDGGAPERREGTVEVTEPMVRTARLVAAATGAGEDPVLNRLVQATVRMQAGTFHETDALVVQDLPFTTVCRTELAIGQAEAAGGSALGIEVRPRAGRRYPHGSLAAHVLGYVGKVNAEDLARWGEAYRGSALKRLVPTDLVGRSGIERQLDGELRGQRGERLAVVDYRSRVQEVLMEVPASCGSDVVLTLDAALQAAAERALDRSGRPGAIVVMDCRSGAILAIASHPTFDLNTFSRDYSRLAEDPDRPLVNRAISGGYPPGSVLKIGVAIAAIQSGSLPTSVDCDGQFLSAHFKDNAAHGSGIALEDALRVSCNVYFFRAAYQTPLASYLDWLNRLGLGQRTGVDLPFEGAGLLPTPEWKRRTGRGSWQLSDTLYMAIGQGEVLVSPLQVARLLAVVANGGRWVTPHLVRELRSAEGPVPRSQMRGEPLLLDASSLARIREGLRQAVQEPGGTARAAFADWPAGFGVAGKTSTAQRRTIDPSTGRARVDNVGWFAGFAPVENPSICFAVALERLGSGESGGSTAAPVAREVLQAVRKQLE